MQIWLNLVLGAQMLTALVMIGLVLVQHGKGADMGASFGSGSSGSLFGATGSANFLSRTTAVCATVFFVCTLALAYLSNAGGRVPQGGSSVLERVGAPVSDPASAPGQIPGGAATVPATLPGAIPAASPGAPSDTAAATVPSASPAPAAPAASAAQIPKQ
jgi:preprotein translocase subunit SecG